jgi:hypothetical protein
MIKLTIPIPAMQAELVAKNFPSEKYSRRSFYFSLLRSSQGIINWVSNNLDVSFEGSGENSATLS